MKPLTQKRRRRYQIAVCLLLLCFVDRIWSLLVHPYPLNLLRAEVLVREEVPAAGLIVRDGGYSNDLFGRSAHAEFVLPGQERRTVFIRMQRPLFFIPWHTTEYRVRG